MTDKLVFAVPSKGRMMEQTTAALLACGLELRKVGSERGYRGEIEGFPNIDVAYVSASEIAQFLKAGQIHLGITGEDLVREAMINADERVSFLKRLGYGHADVVVAVPACWIDVRHMSDLEEMAVAFRRVHGRRLRVATKFTNLTRQFFAHKGVSSYRIVESLGATEGTPASGTSDLIVDITSSGATLRANGLKVLDDGLILKSEANLIASKAAEWSPAAREAENEIMARLGA
ncbi:MAG: ATP phosphoribosyltransferase [Hyphomicrobiaceae bacterium]